MTLGSFQDGRRRKRRRMHFYEKKAHECASGMGADLFDWHPSIKATKERKRKKSGAFDAEAAALVSGRQISSAHFLSFVRFYSTGTNSFERIETRNLTFIKWRNVIF